ncbi:MAG: hypothetical protein IMZ55_04865 [Acidobacteria bacterium]|nr:hypothetical protein [Acidobacteriota bacterium]
MNTTTCIIVLDAWLVAGLIGYILVRRDGLRDGLPWTVGARRNLVMVCILLAPFLFFLGLSAEMLRWTEDDRPLGNSRKPKEGEE